jgi:cobalamin biosynthesis protein CbiG
MIAVGVGASRGCPEHELEGLVAEGLARAGLTFRDVDVLASADVKAGEPAILALADARRWPLRFYSAEFLRAVPVPTPSDVVDHHVGTPSVAEASALLAAGGPLADAELVVFKRRSAHATVAVARGGGR